MRILILVQTCDDAPYLEMTKAQMETWDSIEHPDCRTVYYISSKNGPFDHYTDKGKKLYLDCSEDYNMMHWRNKRALDILCEEEQFDFIFRTNASSYVNKNLLVEFAKTLPKEKCYCGINGGSYASGAGMFMSADVVDIVRTKTGIEPTAYEDAYIGAILGQNGITITPGAQRFEIDHNNYNNIPKCYHYRCKSNTEDRSKDINAFNKIFEKFPYN